MKISKGQAASTRYLHVTTFNFGLLLTYVLIHMRLYPTLLRSNRTRIFALTLLCALLSACLGIPDNARAVTGFELDRYLGTWYEIARLDHRFERGLSHVQANYRMAENGSVLVINKGFDTRKGEWSTAEGKARFIGDPNVGRLKVSFFGPFYGAYNIVELDKENYQYSLVIGPNTDYLWILSRDKNPDTVVIDRLVERARSLGFAVDDLIFPDQSNRMGNEISTTLDLDSRLWNAVNDGVMGGISRGEIIAVNSGLRFQGTLSLENNGGFSSVRRPIKNGLDEVGNIRLKVRGDGRRYQLRLRLDNNWDGVAWRQDFKTNGDWQELDFAIDKFEAVFRGRKLPGYGTLDPSRVRQLGFLIGDGEQAAFRLDVEEIRFTSKPGSS